jgi:hypothetical protein
MGFSRLSDNPFDARIVILSKAKNLMDSASYVFEILRLTPQNDVVGQPLSPMLKRKPFLKYQ